MNLCDIAVADAHSILTDTAYGAARDIEIAPPGSDDFEQVQGWPNDVSEIVDPGTGAVVSGRFISVALSLKSLADAGLDIPTKIIDKNSPVWRIKSPDSSGTIWECTVKFSRPDRRLNIVTLILVPYKAK